MTVKSLQEVYSDLGSTKVTVRMKVLDLIKEKLCEWPSTFEEYNRLISVVCECSRHAGLGGMTGSRSVLVVSLSCLLLLLDHFVASCVTLRPFWGARIGQTMSVLLRSSFLDNHPGAIEYLLKILRQLALSFHPPSLESVSGLYIGLLSRMNVGNFDLIKQTILSLAKSFFADLDETSQIVSALLTVWRSASRVCEVQFCVYFGLIIASRNPLEFAKLDSETVETVWEYCTELGDEYAIQLMRLLSVLVPRDRDVAKMADLLITPGGFRVADLLVGVPGVECVDKVALRWVMRQSLNSFKDPFWVKSLVKKYIANDEIVETVFKRTLLCGGKDHSAMFAEFAESPFLCAFFKKSKICIENVQCEKSAKIEWLKLVEVNFLEDVLARLICESSKHMSVCALLECILVAFGVAHLVPPPVHECGNLLVCMECLDAEIDLLREALAFRSSALVRPCSTNECFRDVCAFSIVESVLKSQLKNGSVESVTVLTGVCMLLAYIFETKSFCVITSGLDRSNRSQLSQILHECKPVLCACELHPGHNFGQNLYTANLYTGPIFPGITLKHQICYLGQKLVGMDNLPIGQVLDVCELLVKLADHAVHIPTGQILNQVCTRRGEEILKCSKFCTKFGKLIYAQAGHTHELHKQPTHEPYKQHTCEAHTHDGQTESPSTFGMGPFFKSVLLNGGKYARLMLAREGVEFLHPSDILQKIHNEPKRRKVDDTCVSHVAVRVACAVHTDIDRVEILRPIMFGEYALYILDALKAADLDVCVILATLLQHEQLDEESVEKLCVEVDGLRPLLYALAHVQLYARLAHSGANGTDTHDTHLAQDVVLSLGKFAAQILTQPSGVSHTIPVDVLVVCWRVTLVKPELAHLRTNLLNLAKNDWVKKYLHWRFENAVYTGACTHTTSACTNTTVQTPTQTYSPLAWELVPDAASTTTQALVQKAFYTYLAFQPFCAYTVPALAHYGDFGPVEYFRPSRVYPRSPVCAFVLKKMGLVPSAVADAVSDNEGLARAVYPFLSTGENMREAVSDCAIGELISESLLVCNRVCVLRTGRAVCLKNFNVPILAKNCLAVNKPKLAYWLLELGRPESRGIDQLDLLFARPSESLVQLLACMDALGVEIHSLSLSLHASIRPQISKLRHDFLALMFEPDPELVEVGRIGLSISTKCLNLSSHEDVGSDLATQLASCNAENACQIWSFIQQTARHAHNPDLHTVVLLVKAFCRLGRLHQARIVADWAASELVSVQTLPGQKLALLYALGKVMYKLGLFGEATVLVRALCDSNEARELDDPQVRMVLPKILTRAGEWLGFLGLDTVQSIRAKFLQV